MLFDGMESGPYDNAERTAGRAWELYEDGEMQQALDALDSALEINPSNDAWHFDRGLTLDAVNRFSDAIEEYETALELNPEDLEILNSLAVDYTRTGQYDRALDMFEHIEQLDPTFEPCYCNRIITYAEMGKHESAEQMFYLAQQIDSDCALCYYNIGNSVFSKGQFKKAVHCWLRASELEPTHPQINFRIAQAYWAEGDTRNAREYFLRELRLNPGDVDVILDFGLFLLEVGDIECAKEKFNRIIELEPEHGRAMFYLGELAFNGGDYDLAVRLYTGTLGRDWGSDEPAGPNYRLSQCAIIAGDKKMARAHLIAELKLGPEDPHVLASMGSMFLSMGEIGHAVNCLLRAVDNDWANADAYYYLGVASVMRREMEEACEFFDQALDIDGKHVETLRDSSLVCLSLGRLDEAAERIDRAAAAAGDQDREIAAARKKIHRAQRSGWFSGGRGHGQDKADAAADEETDE